MADETVLAEPSPAPAVPAAEVLDFAKFHESENNRDLGKPEPPEPKKEDPAPSPEVKPEIKEPEKAAEPEGDDVKNPKTAKRIQELLKDRAGATARAEAAEKRAAEAEAKLNGKQPEPEKVAKPAESTPAPAELKAPVEPVEPEESSFEKWEDYQKALREFRQKERQYNRELVAYETQKAINQAEAKRVEKETADKKAESDRAEQKRVEETTRVWNERVTSAKSKHADFDDVAKKVPFNNAAATFILKSKVGPELLYHLGSNLEEAERIKGLDLTDTISALRDIERELSDPPKPAAHGPKKVPSAPPPPPEVGTRSTVPKDEADSALEAGDFTAFDRAEIQRELKARGARR